jgi:uncharacterized membrane protein YcgQ (UPF0703/DUF1980 family)
MAHDHHHDDPNSYYTEQLFTIAISGALGAVAISLYAQDKLRYILVERFHVWVLAGGISLLVLVLIRAIAVWRSVGEQLPQAHKHHHAEGEHAHEHHHHDHDRNHGHSEGIMPAPAGVSLNVVLSPAPVACHDHDHACCQHDHNDHDHTHDHDHDHTHDHDHDHSWAPWRYVLLLLPVFLYFLNVPSQALSNSTRAIDMDLLETRFKLTDKALTSLRAEKVPEPVLAKLIALKEKEFDTRETFSMELATVLDKDEQTRFLDIVLNHAQVEPGDNGNDTDIYNLGFLELEQASLTEANRKHYAGRLVRLTGEYVPYNERSFTLSRLKMNCCYADAFPLKAAIVVVGSKMPDGKAPTLPVNQLRKKWVQVTGRLTFRPNKDTNEFMPLVIIAPNSEKKLLELVAVTSQDPNPYAN